MVPAAIQIVVQQTRLSDGTRKVTSVSEITGMEGEIITMQEIFLFEKMGVTQDGKVLNSTLAMFSLGGATMDNEWNHLQQKLMRGLGVVAIENQARI